MKRVLFTQMRNEWRDNIWIILSLTIVLMVVWLLFLFMWKEVEGRFDPLGFEYEDVYVVEVESLSPDSPEYVDYGDEETCQAMENEDRKALIRQLRASANVEAAAWIKNADPYTFSYYGGSVALADGTVDTIKYTGNRRWGSPDYAKVLRLKSHNGKSPEELSKMLENGMILLGQVPFDSYYRKAMDLIGKPVFLGRDSTNVYRVGDAIDVIRRNDYETAYSGCMILPVDEQNPSDMWKIILRVKPGKGGAFVEEFDNTPAMQQHRNLYLSGLTGLVDKRSVTLAEPDAFVRMSGGLMCVFLLVIFLGLLGTFWFRVQQRVQEIAIRKVCGASRGDIFRRIIGEGMILLLIASGLAGIIMVAAVKYGKFEILEYWAYHTSPMYIFASFTILLVAMGIVLSISYPAWRAMRIEPGIAVKEE